MNVKNSKNYIEGCVVGYGKYVMLLGVCQPVHTVLYGVMPELL
jgi:hypothetical protein